MDPNILVHYNSSAGYMSGKSEVHNILTKLGDQKSDQTLLVPGIMGVITKLRNRDVIEEVREMFAGDPNFLHATVKWVPVDFWCDASVDKIRDIVKEEIKDFFLPTDQYKIEVIVHKGSLNPEDVVVSVKSWLKGTISDFPQKVLRIEVFDTRASVTVVKPHEIFSTR